MFREHNNIDCHSDLKDFRRNDAFLNQCKQVKMIKI